MKLRFALATVLAASVAIIAPWAVAADRAAAPAAKAADAKSAAAAPADTKPDAAAKKIAAAIDGYRFEFPCKGAMPEKPSPGANCDSAVVTGDPNKTDNFTVEKTFGGEKGKKYNVTLRFRGVVEPMMYKAGKQEGDYFYIGGEPNNGTYNIYKIAVSAPKSHFFLNRQDKVGHRIFTIDYTATIQIEGGATITLHGNGQNGKMISNYAKLVVPDVEPAPKPFNGQFIQINVVDVVELK